MQRSEPLKRSLRSVIQSISADHIRKPRSGPISCEGRGHSTEPANARNDATNATRHDHHRRRISPCSSPGSFRPRRYLSNANEQSLNNPLRSHGSRLYSTTNTVEAAVDTSNQYAQNGESPSNGQSPTDAQNVAQEQDKDKGLMKIQVRRPLTEKHYHKFDEVIAQAENRPADDEAAAARIKSGELLERHYFAGYRGQRQHKLRSSVRRWQRQDERYPSRNAANEWRRIFEMLERTTPFGEEHYKRIVQVVDLPANQTWTFKRNTGRAIAEIMERTSSHVQLKIESRLKKAPYTGYERIISELSLDGTPQQNAAALKILPEYVTHGFDERSCPPDKPHPEAQDNDVSGTEEKDHGPAPIHSVFTIDRTKPRPLPISGQLRRPHHLSTLRVMDYVHDLTYPLPLLAIEKLYGRSGVEHFQVVTEELISFFADAGVAKVVGANTMDFVYSFLTKRARLDAVRTIMTTLENNGYVTPPSNWNSLLAASAKAGDVFSFMNNLGRMFQRDCKPTPITWALFHELTSRRFPSYSLKVAERMAGKGLLNDNRAARLVAQNSTRVDLIEHLFDQKNDLQSFFKLYDVRFGHSTSRKFQWLNVDVVNHICPVLLGIGRVQDAFTVLAEYESRNMSKQRRAALRTDTMNEFLHFGCLDRDTSTAVAILREFGVSTPRGIVPDQVTFMMLFRLVWRQGYFNMLRVVWRYACAAGHVNFAMKERMRRSMFRHRLEGNITRFSIFECFAAKFAVGVQDGFEDALGSQAPSTDSSYEEGASTLALSASEANLVRLALQPKPEDSIVSEDERSPELNEILLRDLSQWGDLEPVRPFVEVLEEAFEKDRKWKYELIAHPKQVRTTGPDIFAGMMSRGIKVPMKPCEGRQIARSWEVHRELMVKRGHSFVQNWETDRLKNYEPDGNGLVQKRGTNRPKKGKQPKKDKSVHKGLMMSTDGTEEDKPIDLKKETGGPKNNQLFAQ